MDRITPFETDPGSIRNHSAFNRKCGKDTVTDIGISGSNEMDKERQRSFFIRTYGQETAWAKNWQKLLRKMELYTV